MDASKTSLSLKRVNLDEYEKTIANCGNAFNKGNFISHNAGKADDTHCLLISKSDSPRFAVAFGVCNGKASCPFSAPFGYPEPLKKGISIEQYQEAGILIDRYLSISGMSTVKMILPPAFYDSSAIEVWKNVFFCLGWKPINVDLNFEFNLLKIADSYDLFLARNARKNLAIAHKAGLSLHVCETAESRQIAYSIIHENREAKGYPLRMTEHEVLETMKIIPSNMFCVMWGSDVIAAALVYDVTDNCAQVVYWGDKPGFSDKKVINYLASELVNIYQKREFEYLDIGPSTENGVPNIGLCNFKDSLGCERSSKTTISKQYARA